MTELLVALALLVFLGWLYFQRKSATGLPPGAIVYDDAGRGHLERPLVSHRLQIAGRPDYLVKIEDGLVPVELKSRALPRSGPLASHIMQLMTYCVLVEDVLGQRVPYGLLHYADAQQQIPFTPGRKREVLGIAAEIRRKRGAETVHRSHRHPARCRKCGFRHHCSESLD